MHQLKNEGLIRVVRRWDLVAIAVNGIIGAGIFGLPSRVYALAGSYSLLAFVICALLTSFIVLCFAEVSSRFSEAGGPYLYAKESFGPMVGFEIGWLVWLHRLFAFSTVCNLLASYIAFFSPAMASGIWRPVTMTIIVIACTLLNIFGVRLSASAIVFLTIAKLIPIALFIITGLFFIRFENFSNSVRPDFQSLSMAVMVLVFAFGGFEFATFNASEARDPHNDIPFAMITGTLVVAGIYILIQLVCIGTLPNLAHSERPIGDASREFLGSAGASVVISGAIISMIGNLNGIMLSAPRLHFAMAKRGQLPGILIATHTRFCTPHVAILVSSVVVLILTLSHSFISALMATTLIRLITYVVTILSMLELRRQGRSQPAAFKAPLGVLIAIISLILCAWLISVTGWREILEISVAAVVGLLIFFGYRTVQSREKLPMKSVP